MNGEVTPQNNQANKNPVLSILGIGLFEIIFVVVCFFLIFGTLNYFNILSVSDAFPKYLGWLPHKGVVQTPSRNIQQSPSPTAVAKITVTISCPLPVDLCSKGKEMDNGDIFSGLAYTLPVNTPVYTAFAGRIEPDKTGPEDPKHPIFSLKDNTGKEVFYSYYGTLSVSSGTEVKAKEEIGKISSEFFPSVPPFTGLNYIFGVKKNGKFQKIAFEK